MMHGQAAADWLQPADPHGEGSGAPMATVKPAVSLEAEFHRLHGRLRRLAVLTGVAWCAAAGFGLMLLIGLIDWSLHVDAALRRQALVGVGGALWGLLLLRLVIVPARRRYDAAQTALRIEAVRPRWRGALVSSIEFSEAQCRPEDGAPALQQSLIARTEGELSADDLEPLVRTRGLRVAGCCAALTVLLCAVLAVIAPSSTGLALQRMFAPRSSASWPREHTLVLLDGSFRPIDPRQPARPGALGERLLVYVDDAAAGLPEQVTLHVTTADGARQSQALERTSISDRAGQRREIGVVMLPAGSPHIKVRAVGGDDDRMPWHTFEFVPRPAVRRFKLRLTPPEYTQLPVAEVVATSGDVAALVGTRVRVEAELDGPVREAAFQQTGLPPTSSQLADDGRLFAIEFPIPATAGGTYAIELVNRDGLRNTAESRFRVEGIADREPTVALTQPAGDLTVTPQAVIPVRIEAGDDLGLVSVRLSVAQPPGSAGEQFRPLPLEAPLVQQASIDTQASPAELQLEPGRLLLLRAEAADAYNLDGHHVVRSVARTLSVVSPEEKQRELVARQAGIAQLLESAVERQAGALQQTRALQLQWRTAAQFAPADVDALRRMAHDQAQIVTSLHDDERGATRQAQAILQELEWNRLQDDVTTQRLSHLDGELGRLKSEVAPTLDRAVAQAVRAASLTGDATPTAVPEVLAEVERGQSTANDLLVELAAMFAGWRRQHDLTRNLAEIVAEQSQLNRETRETGRRTLATPLEALPGDDRAALARLGQRQERTADSLQRFQEHLQALEQRDPSRAEDAAPDVRRAIELLDDGAVAAEMQRAAQLIARNSIAESAETQQSIAAALEQLEQAVRGLDAPAPDTLIRQVERALAEAESLQQRQEQLLNGVQQLGDAGTTTAADSAAPLLRQQQQLAEDTSRWAQRLRRQQLRDAAGSADEAAAGMQSAASRMTDDDFAAARDAQSGAVERLRETQLALQAARKALEFDHTLSEWSRVASLLDACAERQAQLLAESVRLNDEQVRQQGLSRSQMRSLIALGTTQSQLADDVSRLRDSPDGSPIVREALVPAVERMQSAASRLAERLVDDATRAAQQDALDQLRALRKDLDTRSASVSADPTASEPADSSPAAANWPLAIQLKVLIRLQSAIAQRAAAIRGTLAADQTPSDEQRSELQQLGERQSRLAELLGELLSSADAGELTP